MVREESDPNILKAYQSVLLNKKDGNPKDNVWRVSWKWSIIFDSDEPYNFERHNYSFDILKTFILHRIKFEDNCSVILHNCQDFARVVIWELRNYKNPYHINNWKHHCTK